MGDNTIHPIRHIGNVPFGKEDKNNCIKNVLHVPTITIKNLVSIGQIVEQSIQVCFNNGGCFIEKDGRLIARGQREGCRFILDSNGVKQAMYAKGVKTKTEHQVVAQDNWPNQPPMSSSGAIKGSHHRSVDLWVKTSRPMSTQQTTPTSVPKGELCK